MWGGISVGDERHGPTGSAPTWRPRHAAGADAWWTRLPGQLTTGQPQRKSKQNVRTGSYRERGGRDTRDLLKPYLEWLTTFKLSEDFLSPLQLKLINNVNNGSKVSASEHGLYQTSSRKYSAASFKGTLCQNSSHVEFILSKKMWQHIKITANGC